MSFPEVPQNLHIGAEMYTSPHSPTVAIVLTDAQRRILWVNDAFTRMTGYSLEEIFFQKPSVLQGKDTEADRVEEMRFCLENGLAFKSELTNYRKEGEAYKCRLVVQPIRDEHNNITHFIAFEVDADRGEDLDTLEVMSMRGTYVQSVLTEHELRQLFKRLCNLMDTEKLYLNSALTMKTVAQKLHTNLKYLSMAINSQSGGNFQKFLNGYRIDAAKSMLQQPAYRLAPSFKAGQACGFRTRSTFYKVFKEMTGLTPREFQDS